MVPNAQMTPRATVSQAFWSVLPSWQICREQDPNRDSYVGEVWLYINDEAVNPIWHEPEDMLGGCLSSSPPSFLGAYCFSYTNESKAIAKFAKWAIKGNKSGFIQ
jgi:hypothetical protein